jgi:hypothetical protein
MGGDVSEQREQLQRVRGRIAGAILAYLRAVGRGGRFHAADLHEWVRERAGAAPASADRILRDLRQRGGVGYAVIDRAASLYVVTRLPGDEPEQRAEPRPVSVVQDELFA